MTISSLNGQFRMILIIGLILAAIELTASEPMEAQNWTSPATGMEFVWIDDMGLWVGKYEVTNKEYKEKKPEHDSDSFRPIMKDLYNNFDSLDGDLQPVVYVNYDDAQKYAVWMTEQDRAENELPGDYRYRLPTGEEWMTFAQVGDNRIYPWGSQWPPPSGQAGNYLDQTAQRRLGLPGISDYNDGFVMTAPVNRLWQNPWGLHGVGGNAWEATSKSPGGEFEAWRGGSWVFAGQRHLKCSYRFVIYSSARNDQYGFRLLLDKKD